jgi:hypothetical protein
VAGGARKPERKEDEVWYHEGNWMSSFPSFRRFHVLMQEGCKQIDKLLVTTQFSLAHLIKDMVNKFMGKHKVPVITLSFVSILIFCSA